MSYPAISDQTHLTATHAFISWFYSGRLSGLSHQCSGIVLVVSFQLMYSSSHLPRWLSGSLIPVSGFNERVLKPYAIQSWIQTKRLASTMDEGMRQPSAEYILSVLNFRSLLADVGDHMYAL